MISYMTLIDKSFQAKDFWFCLPGFRCLHEQWPNSDVQAFAWKVLGILPVLKASAVTNQDDEWQKQRRLRLYHRCMDYVIADENELCKEKLYLRFADKKVRLVQFFHYFTSMDGLEIAATALTSTKDCPTCECPRHLLGKTNRLYPIRGEGSRGAAPSGREYQAPLHREGTWYHSMISYNDIIAWYHNMIS